jgi:hypothetical protein
MGREEGKLGQELDETHAPFECHVSVFGIKRKRLDRPSPQTRHILGELDTSTTRSCFGQSKPSAEIKSTTSTIVILRHREESLAEYHSSIYTEKAS